MSEDLKKALDTALSRIASLEAETSRHRNAPDSNAAIKQILEQMVVDPIGTASQYGLPVDHMTKVFVAHAMGKEAPSELRSLAMQGPQISAQRATDAKLEQLSRQFASFMESVTKKSAAESFQALVKDKTKYPHLSKAYEADPELYGTDSVGANAEEFMSKEEKRLTKLHSIWNPKPASEENADETTGQSTKTEPAKSQGPELNHLGQPVVPAETKPVKPDVPPIAGAKPGVFTPDEHARIRDMVVRKYESQAKSQ